MNHTKVQALLAVLLVAGCAYIRTPSRADSFSLDEKLEYLVLAVLSDDAGRDFLRLPDPMSRYEFVDSFWSQPDFAASGDSLRELYLNRATRARALFGMIDLLNDDRVRAFIRHGPARRASYRTRPGTKEWLRSPDTPIVTFKPAEIWTWDSLGLQQDFIRTGTAFRLIGETRFGPHTFPPALETTDSFAPAPAPTQPATGFGFELAVARFSSESDTVETEVHFGVPGQDIKHLSETGVSPAFRIDFHWRNRRQGPDVYRRIFVAPAQPDTDTALVVGRQVFRLPVADYELTVTATRSDGSARPVTHRVDLIAYARRVQPASDMAFFSLVDSTYQSTQFEGHGWRRLVPAVRPAVLPGGTANILFALYNLATDPEGRQRVNISYDIYETANRHAAIIPTLDKHITGEGPTVVVVERLHVMDLAPGEYVVVARCRDEIASRNITVTGEFRIMPR